MASGTHRLPIMVTATLVAAMVAVLPVQASDSSPVPLPAAGELSSATASVRVAPEPRARVVRELHQFGTDSQFQIVLAIAAHLAPDGVWWYELSLPGRPNGQRGWVSGDSVDLRPVQNQIVVHVKARRLEVRRLDDGRVLLRAVVAVGKPGAETPLGSDFFVQARAVPIDPFFGTFVLVTSAYSKLSDWPGGGLAGIHGTDEPNLLGRAVSHGCVRVSNGVARRLERLAPLGTVVDLLP